MGGNKQYEVEFRIPGLLTISLHDDSNPNPRYWKYIVYPEDYESRIAAQDFASRDELYYIFTALRLKVFLLYTKKLSKFDLNFNSLVDYIYNYGGVNINVENGGWKAFTPLKVDYDKIGFFD